MFKKYLLNITSSFNQLINLKLSSKRQTVTASFQTIIDFFQAIADWPDMWADHIFVAL